MELSVELYALHLKIHIKVQLPMAYIGGEGGGGDQILSDRDSPVFTALLD